MHDVVTGRPPAAPITLTECHACGTPVWPQQHCTACGAALTKPRRRIVCRCGRAFLGPTDRFCGDCGAPRLGGS